MAAWDGVFWRATAERCIGTAAASGMTFLTLDVVTSDAFDWKMSALAVAVTTGYTFLKCIVANTSGTAGPGFGSAETLEEKK